MWFCYDLMITILQGYFCCQVGTPNAQHFQNLLWFFFCSGKLRICPQFHSLGLELDIANKHCILQFLYREKRQKFSLLCEMVTRCRIVSKNLGFFSIIPTLLPPIIWGYWLAGTGLPAFFYFCMAIATHLHIFVEVLLDKKD